MTMQFRKAWKRYLRIPSFCVAAGLAVFTSCLWLRQHALLQPLELSVYDQMLSWHVQPREYRAANDVVVVGVDETDLQLLRHYPITDADRAALLTRLLEGGATVIGMDLYSDIPVGNEPAASDSFRRLLGAHGNIVCGYFLGKGSLSHPEVPSPRMIVEDQPAQMQGRRIGFTDQPFDDDGICRRALLFMSDQRSRPSARVAGALSLSVAVANRYLEGVGTLKRPDPTNPADLQDPAHLSTFWSSKLQPRFQAGDGGYTRVDDTGFQYLVDYRGPDRPQPYPTIHLRQLIPDRLDPAEVSALPEDDRPTLTPVSSFTGKAVLIGMTADSVKDYIATPMQHRYDRFGVYQHAALVDQLIRTARDRSVSLAWWPPVGTFAWALLWTVIGTAGGMTARFGYSTRAPWRLLVVVFFGEAVILGVAVWCFHRGTWVQVVPASFCLLGTAVIVGSYAAQLERENRNALDQIFADIVQKELARELWKRRDELFENGRLKPRRLTATLLFSDLKGFSAACETMPQEQVIEWINNYHDAMSQFVAQYRGVIVRYMGDGMMAVFGAPSAHHSDAGYALDARNAVNCALTMRQKLIELHATWPSHQWPRTPLRIGIQSGVVIEGSVGSRRRLEYATLGDTVNTAARLESYDKTLMSDQVAPNSCRILIGQNTFDYVGELVNVIPVGKLELSGMRKEMNVYAVTGPADPAPPANTKVVPDERSAVRNLAGDAAATAPRVATHQEQIQ